MAAAASQPTQPQAESESSSSSEPATEEPESSEAEEETAAPSQDLEVADDCPTAGDARDDLFPWSHVFLRGTNSMSDRY